MAGSDKIYYDENGRAYRKEPFEKKIPKFHYVWGRFTGKFHSDKIESEAEKSEFFDFKIYEGEVEILYKSTAPRPQSEIDPKSIKISPAQLPEKIYFFERKGDGKVYYKIKLKNPVFHNFRFISRLQQTEDSEAFGTVEGEIYGAIVTYDTEKWYKKRYKKIQLIPQGGLKKVVIPPPPPPTPPTPPPPKTQVSECFGKLMLALGLTVFSVIIGFAPLTVIALLWLFYIIFKCYFRWLRWLAYLFGLLFLIGLLFSILNTNWNRKTVPYIPRAAKQKPTRPELVKVIKYISKDGKREDILITHKMNWNGYSGENYSGEYSLKKSDLELSRQFKNSLSTDNSYAGILFQLSKNDSEKLGGLYQMFDKIRAEKQLNDKIFAEMIVSFVQQIPYYLVLDGSCNPNEYKDPTVAEILKQNPGHCVPNQKFGITTPAEFMVNLQGDCDSRTVLLYTILKHYRYDAAIFSSDIYKHSILGIALPYSGLKYNTSGKQYVLWETTTFAPPGNIPPQVTNLNNWYLTIN